MILEQILPISGDSEMFGTSFTLNSNMFTTSTVSLAPSTDLVLVSAVGEDDDIIEGTDGDDVLDGGLGDDILSGGAGNDLISGGAGEDQLQGDEGDDTLEGGAGDDQLAGGAGDDVLAGGGGNDQLNGGTGIDTLSLADIGAGVTASLATGIASYVPASGALIIDTFINIENILGSAFDDALTGDDGDNVLTGAGGSDALAGGAGDDTLVSDAVDDIDGGEGTDTADFTDATSAIVASLADGVVDTVSVLEDGSTDLPEFGETAAFFPLETGISRISNTVVNAAGVPDLPASDVDVFTFEVPEGATLTSLILSEATSTDDVGFIALQAGDAFTVDLLAEDVDPSDLLGLALFGEGALAGAAVGNNILPGLGAGGGLLPPEAFVGFDGEAGLGAGVFTLLVQQLGGAAIDFSLDFVVTGPDGDGVGTLIDVENLTGSEFDDTLIGDMGANVLTGNGGADLLFGGAGDDVFVSDALDAIDGADGIDTVDLSGLSVGVTVDLDVNDQGNVAPGDATQEGAITLDGASVSVSDVENVIGTSGDDLLFGNDEMNVIEAGAGDDAVHGFGGADTLDGGDGVDTLLFAGAFGGVSVDLAAGTAGPNVITGFENVSGGAFDDALTGDEGDNVLIGGTGMGADTLDGGAGDDALIGGGGGDLLIGGLGDDVLRPGGGNDVIFGGMLDFDVVTSSGDFNGGLNALLVFDGQTGEFTGTLENLETFPAIEGFDGLLVNNDPRDVVLDGPFGALSTSLLVNTGFVPPAPGNDLTLRISQSGDFVEVFADLGDSGFFVDPGGAVFGPGDDFFVGSRTEGTVFQFDAETGAFVPNEPVPGDASLTGFFDPSAVDFPRGFVFDPATGDLFLGSGSNPVTGEGADTIIRVDFETREIETFVGPDQDATFSPLDVILNPDASQIVISSEFPFMGGSLAAANPGTVRFYDIETGELLSVFDPVDENGDPVLSAPRGLGFGPDGRLFISSSANGRIVALDTETGAFEIFAELFETDETGAVTANINGQALNFILPVDFDPLAGGVDTVSFEDISFAVTADLTTGLADYVNGAGVGVQDVLIGIENLTGTAADDSLTGNDLANTLIGAAGADTLSGGDGDDVLVGGAGGDVLIGGGGDDVLASGGGFDVVDGGEGFDVVSFADLPFAVTASFGLTDGTAEYLNGAGVLVVDSLANIEGFVGSAFGDLVTGSIAANVLSGGEGDDTLNGNAGDDTLGGESGDDVLDGGLGADGLAGGAGNDALFGDLGDDTLDGGTGDDILDGGLGDDTLLTDGGTDTHTGGLGADIFVFGGGDATVTDFAEGDFLFIDTVALELDDMVQSVDQLEPLATQDGADLILDFGSATLTLLDTMLDDLSEENVDFLTVSIDDVI